LIETLETLDESAGSITGTAPAGSTTVLELVPLKTLILEPSAST